MGAGTVHSFMMTTGGRARSFRMRVAEPDPGRVLTESDERTSMVTTWVVTPEGPGCRVRVETRWQGAGGVGGLFERLFAPGAAAAVCRGAGAAGPLRPDGAARLSG